VAPPPLLLLLLLLLVIAVVAVKALWGFPKAGSERPRA
jgi:hypothetical protein